MIFKPGSAVEVSIEGKGSSWFSGTIISCMDCDRFLVQYNHNMVEKAVVNLHQLRPLPPLESHWEFKFGDKVEAFHKHCWWEGHVTKDLGKGRFVVSLRDLDEIPFPKELLRSHQEWINHNWVPSCRDRISELPDNVLLHILNFMDTKHAVQTCVLSKRWKHLCKRLTNLKFDPTFKHILYRRNIENFEKFASWVLSSRDDSYSLLSLNIRGLIEPNLLDRVIKYALFHNIQELTMYIYTGYFYFESLPLIFCCQSLASLKLFVDWNHSAVVLPKSMDLPVLKSLFLSTVRFIASDNNSAEPFSNCHMLEDLVLTGCYNDAQVLSITNSSLSSLTIFSGQAYQIKLTTPYLSSFTITGSVRHQIFSTHNLSFLEEVYIDISTWDDDWNKIKNSPIIIGWLQVLSNVKILTLSMHAIRIILRDLSLISFPTRPQPPSFVRLESFKVKMYLNLSENVSDEEVNKVKKYLLQNSPLKPPI